MTRHHRSWHLIIWLILVPFIAVLAFAAQDLAGRREAFELAPAQTSEPAHD